MGLKSTLGWDWDLPPAFPPYSFPAESKLRMPLPTGSCIEPHHRSFSEPLEGVQASPSSRQKAEATAELLRPVGRQM